MRGALSSLPLLALIAAAVALTPAPWPVLAHDSSYTNYNPSAILLPKYCRYNLGHEANAEVYLIAPDVAASTIALQPSVKGQAFATDLFANVSRSRAAQSSQFFLPNATSGLALGFAANGASLTLADFSSRADRAFPGSQVVYITSCTAGAMHVYALPVGASKPTWDTDLATECTPSPSPHLAPYYFYNTFANAVDLLRQDVSMLMRIDGASGDILWQSPLSQTLAAQGYKFVQLGLDTGDVLVCAQQPDILLALYNGKTGQVLWESNFTIAGYSPSVNTIASTGLIFAYLSSSDQKTGQTYDSLVAISTTSGAAYWQAPEFTCPGAFVRMTFVSVNGTQHLVVVCSGDSSAVYLFHIGSGNIINNFTVPYGIVSAVGVVDNVLMSGNEPGSVSIHLLAYDVTTGAKTLEQLGTGFESLAVDERGRIFFQSETSFVLDSCDNQPHHSNKHIVLIVLLSVLGAAVVLSIGGYFIYRRRQGGAPYEVIRG